MSSQTEPTSPQSRPPTEPEPDPSVQRELLERLSVMRRRTMIVRRLVSVMIAVMLAASILSTWSVSAFPQEHGLSASFVGGRLVAVRNYHNALTQSNTAQLGELKDGAIVWREAVNGTIHGVEKTEDGPAIAFFEDRALVVGENLKPLPLDNGGKVWRRSTILGDKGVGCAYGSGVVWVAPGENGLWLAAPDETGQEVVTKLDLKELSQPVLSIGCFAQGERLSIFLLTAYGNGGARKTASSGQIWNVSFVPRLESTEDGPQAWVMTDERVVSLASHANLMLPIQLGSRIGLFWRSAEDGKASVRFGDQQGWSKDADVPAGIDAALPRAASGILSALVQPGAGQMTSMLTGDDRSVKLLERIPQTPNFQLREFPLGQSGFEAAPARDLGVIQAGMTTLWIDEGWVIGIMLFSFVGVLGCTLWLGFQRRPTFEMEIRALALERVGRDVAASEAPVGMPIDLLIPWANALRRLLAFFIDLMAMFPLGMAMAELAGFDADLVLSVLPQSQAPLHGIAERSSFLMLIAVYGFICEYYFGRTLGKAVMRIQVVTAKGQRAGAVAIWLRNISRAVEVVAPFGLLLTFLTMTLTRKHQRIGDLIARTGVRVMPPPGDPAAGEPSHSEER